MRIRWRELPGSITFLAACTLMGTFPSQSNILAWILIGSLFLLTIYLWRFLIFGSNLPNRGE